MPRKRRSRYPLFRYVFLENAIYDQSALILAHFSIFLSAITSRRVSSRVLDLGGLFAIQLLILLLGMQPDSAQHHYTWVPVALLLLVWRQNMERRVPVDL